MLPKQLERIKNHLEGKEELTQVQQELLAELELLSDDQIIHDQLLKGRLFESFALAGTHCPIVVKPISYGKRILYRSGEPGSPI